MENNGQLYVLSYINPKRSPNLIYSGRSSLDKNVNLYGFTIVWIILVAPKVFTSLYNDRAAPCALSYAFVQVV